MKNLPLDTHPPGLHYHRLKDGQFRVVEVQPGNPEDILDIEMKLITFRVLEENDKYYVPVSYRWAPEQERIPAKIMGDIVLVPRGLDHLMRRARNPEGSGMCRTMWIDQLCINQDDDEDKAHQVPLMRQIYERAAGTIVWLGDEGIEDCELAFGLMKRWSDLFEEDETANLDTLPLETILGPPTQDNLRSFRALRLLLDNNYWERTWIMQEATSHENTAVWYGDMQDDLYPIDYIFRARNLVMQFVARNAPSVYGLEITPSAKVGRVELFRELREDDHPHPLLEILTLFRRTKCTDPRDKIYSALSFAADVGEYTEDCFLRPDYERDVFEVYVDVARWYLCTAQNLNILGYCASYSESDTLFLPSWVPNWTQASYIVPLPKYLDETVDASPKQPMYSACGLYSHVSQLVFPPPDGWRTNSLFLSGLHVATVCRVLEPVSDLFMSLETERSWQDSFEPSASYPLSDESMEAAFGRTLMVDREELSRRRTKFRRGGHLIWPDNSSTTADFQYQTRRIKSMTKERTFFYAHCRSAPSVPDEEADNKKLNNEELDSKVGADGTGLIMALGRHDVQVGDEIWALKGGSVLYVLRRMGPMVKLNNSETQEALADNLNMPDQLWFNGRKRDWSEPLMCYSYFFCGEAYAHGLMDGEAVEYATKDAADRPEVLSDMASEFQEILVGMGSLATQNSGASGNDKSIWTYHIGSEREPKREESSSGKKAHWKVY